MKIIVNGMIAISLLLNACQKQALNTGLHGLVGKWKLNTLYRVENEPQIAYSLKISGYADDIILEIDKDAFTFSSDTGVETFRIGDQKVIDETVTYPNGAAMTTKKLEIVLINKKKQRFYFSYRFNDGSDVEMVGDYWKKDQLFYSTDNPNASVANIEGDLEIYEGRFQRIN